MKHLLLFLLFLPLISFSQENDPLLSKEIARQHQIKTVRIITLMSLPRDTTKIDTAVIEIQRYNEQGTIQQKDYSITLDKSTYKTQTEFYYSTSGELLRTIERENGRTVDSIVFADPSHYTSYRRNNEKRILHVTAGDSIREIVISATDTIYREWRKKIAPAQTEYHGLYDLSITKHDTVAGTDTSIFYLKGEKRMMLVHHSDRSGHAIQTDYYNYSDKYYRIYSAPYNANYTMYYYMNTSKKGKRTYQVFRKFNSQGWLVEEKLVGPGKRNPVIIKRFYYG